jgi:hypothetical protein
MRTPFIVIFLAAAAPAAGQDASIREVVRIAAVRLDQDPERIERDRQRELERAQRDQARAKERAERERERASQRQDGIQETERSTRTLKIGASGEVHLATISGDIVISRGGGNEAFVEFV